MDKKTTVFDTCIKITSELEGASFDSVTNSFDGQGLSLGILQWNIGTGSFRDHILNNVNVMSFDYFPTPIVPLYSLNNKDAVNWVKDVILDNIGNVKPEWEKAIKRFLTEPTIINQQKRACDVYFHQAKCIAGKMGFTHSNTRAMAWSFDLAVQSWSLKIDRPKANKLQAESIKELSTTENYIWWVDKELSEDQQILLIASHLRSLHCLPEWRKTFFTRKAAIAIGCGIVNNTKYDFNKLFTES